MSPTSEMFLGQRQLFRMSLTFRSMWLTFDIFNEKLISGENLIFIEQFAVVVRDDLYSRFMQ